MKARKTPRRSLPEGLHSKSIVTGGRVGPPTSGVPGSLYDFVRRHVFAKGGSCTRDELVEAITADPGMNTRLASCQGFRALLNNMQHSGDIILDGEMVRVTGRTLRRVGIHPI